MFKKHSILVVLFIIAFCLTGTSNSWGQQTDSTWKATIDSVTQIADCYVLVAEIAADNENFDLASNLYQYAAESFYKLTRLPGIDKEMLLSLQWQGILYHVKALRYACTSLRVVACEQRRILPKKECNQD